MRSSTSFSETTQTIHGGDCRAEAVRTPGPSIQRGSTVLLPSAAAIYDTSRTTYGRGGLATHKALCNALAELEGAETALLFPSGLSAITATLQALTSAGDEILISDSAYNPTRRFLDGTLSRFGVTSRYFPPAAGPEELAQLVTPKTRLIFLESPGSLTFEMQDVPAIARFAHDRGILTVIDNTWAAGVLFKPLEHGIDVSIQALTKYVCGHSDVFMGSACARGPVVDLLQRSSYEVGWAVSPDDAYLALRGLRTLHARLAQHGATALRVAAWLAEQPEVQSVLCPGLPTFPGHEIWRRDFAGVCGLFGAVLHETSETAVAAMLDGLELFGLGYSWGGFESLAIPCDPQLASRTCSGVFPGPLLRLHVGLESPDDLMADLRRGLDRLGQARESRRANPALAL